MQDKVDRALIAQLANVKSSLDGLEEAARAACEGAHNPCPTSRQAFMAFCDAATELSTVVEGHGLGTAPLSEAEFYQVALALRSLADAASGMLLVETITGLR